MNTLNEDVLYDSVVYVPIVKGFVNEPFGIMVSALVVPIVVFPWTTTLLNDNVEVNRLVMDVSADVLVLISVERPVDKDVSAEPLVLISVERAVDKDVSAEPLVLISVERPVDKDVSAEPLTLVSVERSVDKDVSADDL